MLLPKFSAIWFRLLCNDSVSRALKRPVSRLSTCPAASNEAKSAARKMGLTVERNIKTITRVIAAKMMMTARTITQTRVCRATA